MRHGTVEWHEARKNRVGASEVATLIDENPYSSPAELWGIKKGLIESKYSSAAFRGQDLEEGVAKMFSRKTGRSVTPDQDAILKGPCIITCDYRDDHGQPVEIKTSVAGYRDYWNYQVQMQMWGTDAQQATIAWMDSSLEVDCVVIQRDEELIEQLVNAADDFVNLMLPLDSWPGWAPGHIKGKVTPVVRGSSVTLDPSIAMLLAEYKGISKQLKDLEGQKKDLYSSIVNALGENETGLFDGREVVTYRQAKSSSSFDVTGFCLNYPEESRKWMINRPGSRRLYVKDDI